jgi:uncharacterized membrane protein YkvA (DUF1232 family)
MRMVRFIRSCLRAGVLTAAFTTALIAIEPGMAGSGAAHASLHGLAFQDETIEQQVGRFTRETVRGIRYWFRRAYRLVTNSLRVWGRWLRRALYPISIALVFLLADPALIAAWRREGLRVLVENVPLMLYVYLRLLFSPRVAVPAKLLLLMAILYGVKRADLIPDRGLVAGRFDDIVVIALATRAFVRACPEEMVERLAAEAVGWRRRMQALRNRR